jgi:hypothetical protein
VSERLGAWLALFPRRRAPAFDALVQRIGQWPGVTARRTTTADGAEQIEVTAFSITLGLDTAAAVRDEAAELAEASSVTPDLRATLAEVDARLEIVWSLRDSEAAFHTLLFIKDLIKELSGAVVFDTTGGDFI